MLIHFLYIEIEEDYDGPKLEDGKVTLKFMEELIEYYKNQKKLHRKFAYKVIIDYTVFTRIFRNVYRYFFITPNIKAMASYMFPIKICLNLLPKLCC